MKCIFRNPICGPLDGENTALHAISAFATAAAVSGSGGNRSHQGIENLSCIELSALRFREDDCRVRTGHAQQKSADRFSSRALPRFLAGRPH